MARERRGGVLSRGFRWIARPRTAARVAQVALDDEQRGELLSVAKDPKKWGERLSDGWDKARIEAAETSDAFVVLGKVGMGRKVSREERKACVRQLAALGVVIPAFRVFMIPGSSVLLGVASRVTPWRLLPDIKLPEPDLLEQLRERFGGDAEAPDLGAATAEAVDVLEHHPERLVE